MSNARRPGRRAEGRNLGRRRRNKFRRQQTSQRGTGRRAADLVSGNQTARSGLLQPRQSCLSALGVAGDGSSPATGEARRQESRAVDERLETGGMFENNFGPAPIG